LDFQDDRKRQSELREYVAVMHMLCLLILASALILDSSLFAKGVYPIINIRSFALVGLMGFLAVLLYNSKTPIFSLSKKSLTWLDFAYVIFPLLVSVLILFYLGNSLPYADVVLLLPIIIAASILGKNAGLIMATVCSALLIFCRIFFLGESIWLVIQSKLLFIWIVYIEGWFIGGLTNIEAQYIRQLHYRAELEKFIAITSKKFINLDHEEMDDEIVFSLGEIASLTRADRCRILLFSGENKLEVTHEWQAKKVKPWVEPMQDLVTIEFPWLMEKLNSLENINISSIAGLPPEAEAEKEFLRVQGIQSLIVTPLVYGKTLLGLLWVDSMEVGKNWPEGITSFLKILGDVFINALKRKQAEEELRLSEERFFKAFNSTPNAMTIVTLKDGRFLDVNESFLHSTGYTREEVIGHTVEETDIWVNQQDRLKILKMLREKGAIRNFETSFYTKLKELQTVLLSAEIINLGGKPCILSTATNITERKQMEEDMARLERLHLVGEMAAGISHEMRNPMTTVRGFLQLLGGKEDCLKYKGYFDLMISELDRANSIITEYLKLAKDKAMDLKVQNLNTIVLALLPLIQADAVIANKFAEAELKEIPDLRLDEKEICQLILNLVRNGLEAMPPGGVLIIKTFVEDKEVVMAVEDQGMGIAPDLLEKIGTPFFTTKEKGTGLGLAVCYSIAERHKARISIQTSSSGTTFTIRFKVEDRIED